MIPDEGDPRHHTQKMKRALAEMFRICGTTLKRSMSRS
jgi:hypothetical protein